MSAIYEAVSGRDRRQASGGQNAVPALWRGTVAYVRAEGVFCTVPHLAGVHPLGPMPSAVPGLVEGARVIVAAIEGRRDDLMVLAAA